MVAVKSPKHTDIVEPGAVADREGAKAFWQIHERKADAFAQKTTRWF